MSSLSKILQDTLLFTASAGRPLATLLSNQIVTPPLAPKEKDPKDPLWSWRYSEDQINVVKDLCCNNPYLGHVPMMVCKSIEWEYVKIRSKKDPAIDLPLSKKYLLRKLFLPSGEVTGEGSLWKLPALIDSSHLIVFGYQLGGDAKTVPAVIPQIEWESEGFMPSPGPFSRAEVFQRSTGMSHTIFTPVRRVIVCLSLVCCKEKDDWDPSNSLDAARMYAHMMVMTNFDMYDGDHVTASIRMQRPSKSTHAHGAKEQSAHMHGTTDEHVKVMHESMNDDIRPFLFADTNSKANKNAYYIIPDLPFWDNLFDYYDLNPLVASKKFVAVHPDNKARSIENSVSYRNGRDKVFHKVDRQGEFDNLHLAPTMKVPKGLRSDLLEVPSQVSKFDFDDIKMSPFCVHDCLHTHWRWNDNYTRAQNKGWSEIGPNSKAGAPLVPMNQKVEVELSDSGFCTVVTIMKGFKSGDWQVINHNGSAYALNGDMQGYAAQVGTIYKGFKYNPLNIHLVKGEWWAFYWKLRYDVTLGWHEKMSEKIERVRINDLSQAKK